MATLLFLPLLCGQVPLDPEVVKHAASLRKANIARFRSGRMGATWKFDGREKLVVDFAWAGDRGRWTYASTQGSPSARPEGPPTETVARGKVVFDGVQYHRLLDSGDGNHYMIQPPKRWTAPNLMAMRMFPSDLWGMSLPPARRTWDELLGPHPRFHKNEERTWSMVRRNGDLVELHRTDPGGGHATFVVSLALAGNVVETHYRGNGQDADSKYEWTPAPTVRLVRATSRLRHPDSGVTETSVEVTSFEPNVAVPAEELTAAWLRVPPGTPTYDQGSRKKYVTAGD